jgi:DNA-binding CsgD family transcriptional regulator
VLVRGEAGVGKTALITRFVAGVGPGLRVLVGWCDPLVAPRPLGPLIDALAGLDGRVAAGVAGAVEAGDTAALYRRLLEVFSGGQRWVWVIEDAHWADGATLDLLRFVGRRIGGLGLLLVVSYRDDEVGVQHPLAAAIGDIATGAAITRVGLDPLSRQAVEVLAVGSGVNATELYRLSGGNPFYVSEVLAAGGQWRSGGGLPRSVAEAVRGRLARLSVIGRETAYAVAVCGPRAEAVLVEKVCPAARVGLAECVGAGVLVGVDAVVGFRHELARRATLDAIPDPQRRALHRRAMTALAESPVAPDMWAALTLHAEQAGDAEAVVRYGVAGAQRAAALGANREAAELYALVLAHAQHSPPAQKVTWIEGHAFARYLCGEASVAVVEFREAIKLRRALGDRLGEGQNLRLVSHMLWGGLGHTAEAIEAARASLNLLEDLGPTPQLAWAVTNMVHMTAVSYDPACADYAAQAIALGTQLGDPGVVVRARCFAALASVFGGGTAWEDCETTWRAAIAVPELAEHLGLIGSAMCWIAALHHDLDRAQRYIDGLSAICDADDLGAYQPMAVGAAALVALHRGDWTRANLCAEDVLTRPRVGLINAMLPMIVKALVQARRGRAPAGPLLDGATDNSGPGDFFYYGAAWAARAEMAWLAGDDEGARCEARRGLAAAGPRADPWLTGRLHRWLRLAGADVGPVAASAVALTPYQLELSGDWRAAAAEWAGRGCPYDAALAQLGGDAAAVHTALQALHRLGARAAARRAQQRLTELGGPQPRGPARRTATDPHGLTSRQRQVADLLAAGTSDAAIAAALHLSPRTVSHHVEAILTKLGVANRTQAAHALQHP